MTTRAAVPSTGTVLTIGGLDIRSGLVRCTRDRSGRPGSLQSPEQIADERSRLPVPTKESRVSTDRPAGEAAVIAFRDAAEFEAWLDAHADLQVGVWLKIAKKAPASSR